jgi:hypothetical protein
MQERGRVQRVEIMSVLSGGSTGLGSVVPHDKMLNILNGLKWRRSLQYAAAVTGQFKAGMGQQTSNTV